LLEVNALWYNAVRILAELYQAIGKKRKHAKLTKIADKIKIAFNTTLVNDDGFVLDFVNNDVKNKDFRINQVIPLALPFSPFEDMFARKVLDQIERDLLTPYGLRSALSAKNAKDEILHRKSPAYYNGAVWPWAVGFYAEAALRYASRKERKALILKNYFSPIGQLVNKGLINYLPEAISYNGKPIQKGIADFTPSLSSVLWMFYLLEKEIKQT